MLFRCQTNLKSYKFPILKIIISVLIIVILIFRDKIFNVTNKPFQIIISIIAFIVTIFSILCIYISVAEMMHVHENKKNESLFNSIIDKSMCASKSIDEIVDLVRKNDIVQFVIATDKGTVRAGASSDYKHSKGIFFDKLYYINETEYKQIENFKNALATLASEGMLFVYSIDDIVIEKNR